MWQQEYDKAMEKEQEQQKQNELKQNKKKLRKLFEINRFNDKRNRKTTRYCWKAIYTNKTTNYTV